MLAIADQTAGPNWLKYLGTRGVTWAKKFDFFKMTIFSLHFFISRETPGT